MKHSKLGELINKTLVSTTINYCFLGLLFPSIIYLLDNFLIVAAEKCKNNVISKLVFLLPRQLQVCVITRAYFIIGKMSHIICLTDKVEIHDVIRKQQNKKLTSTQNKSNITFLLFNIFGPFPNDNGVAVAEVAEN